MNTSDPDELSFLEPLGIKRVVSGLMDVFGANSFQQPSYTVVVHEVIEKHFNIGSQRFD